MKIFERFHMKKRNRMPGGDVVEDNKPEPVVEVIQPLSDDKKDWVIKQVGDNYKLVPPEQA